MLKSLFLIILFCSQSVFAQQWFRSLPIGSNSLDSSSIFDVNSTIKGSRPCPPMTEVQRDAISSPATALCIYNSDTNLLNFYNGTIWGSIGAGGGGGDLWSDLVDSDIIADGDGTRDIGSLAVRFALGTFDQLFAGDVNLQTANNSLAINGALVRPDGALSNIPMTIETKSNATANATPTGTLYLLSGNKTAGTGDSGDIVNQLGTSSGGVRGKYFIKDGSEGISGECWVSTGTGGEGNWDTCPGSGGALSPTGTVGTPIAIVPASGITPSGDQREVIFLESTSGTQVVTANPQIAAGSAVGEELILIGTSATEILVINDGTGLALNGTMNLNLQSSITLMWDGSKWQELSRR